VRYRWGGVRILWSANPLRANTGNRSGVDEIACNSYRQGSAYGLIESAEMLLLKAHAQARAWP
jgi:hypothetical protein